MLPHPPQAGPDSVVNALQFDLSRGEVDTESVRTVPAEGYPEDPAEEDDVNSDDEEEELPFHIPGAATGRAAFASLDEVALVDEFDERACVMKSVLRFLAGPLQDRNACRIGRDQYRGCAPSRERVEALHASAKNVAAPVPKRGSCWEGKLLKRFEHFHRGAWTSRTCCQQAAVVRRRRSRRGENDLGRRVERSSAWTGTVFHAISARRDAEPRGVLLG